MPEADPPLADNLKFSDCHAPGVYPDGCRESRSMTTGKTTLLVILTGDHNFVNAISLRQLDHDNFIDGGFN